MTRFKAGTYELDDLSFQSGAKSDLDATHASKTAPSRRSRPAGFVPPQARAGLLPVPGGYGARYWTGMAGYLKNELKVKSLISGTQLGYSPPHVQAELDYIDNHSYWCHPSPVSKDWRIRNVPMVNSLSCIQRPGRRSGSRTSPTPSANTTIRSRTNTAPRASSMLRAYGALQGWDGVFEYTYNHSPDFEPDRNTYFFSIIARTDVLAHFPACAAMFLRGDVREAKPASSARLTTRRTSSGWWPPSGRREHRFRRLRSAADLAAQDGRGPDRQAGHRAVRRREAGGQGAGQRHGRADVEHRAAGGRRTGP